MQRVTLAHLRAIIDRINQITGLKARAMSDEPSPLAFLAGLVLALAALFAVLWLPALL